MPVDLEQLGRAENARVEWKESVADELDVVKTLVAFANDLHNLGGGWVVCGAREVRDAHGFPTIERPGLSATRLKTVRERVLNVLRTNVHPPLTPQVEEEPTGDPSTRILVFTMAQTGQAHSHRDKADGASGRYWVRIDQNTLEARNGLLLQLLTLRGLRPAWDLRTREDATRADLDLVRLRTALVRMGLYVESKGVEVFLDPGQRMHSLVPELCTAEPLTGRVWPRNFGLLLFGADTQRWSMGAHVVFAIYPGTDRSSDHGERHTLLGTVVEQADELLRRLEGIAPDVFDKGGPRENLPRYPRRVMKEAAVNALAHRNYEIDEPIHVTVFSDRLEIRSPGALPEAVSEVAFRAGRASPHWRNSALRQVFDKLDLAQSQGQGVATILRLMLDEGYPPPEFELDKASVTVTLRPHPAASGRPLVE